MRTANHKYLRPFQSGCGDAQPGGCRRSLPAGDMEKFWKIFDERLELCYRALMCRHERLKGTLSDAAPILWQYGALCPPEEGRTHRQAAAWAAIPPSPWGMRDCVSACTLYDRQIPYGSVRHTVCPGDHAQYNECRRATLERARHHWISAFTARRWNPRPINSPNACRSRFGIIEGVTDKGYITNSYHVHVTEEIDAFDKLAFEATVPGAVHRRSHQLCGSAQHAAQPGGGAAGDPIYL